VTPPDVLVVGAGPAGAWAAYQLARAGARVDVFDPSHPREKPCGGGVTGRALAVVQEALERYPVPAVAVTRARFEAAAPASDGPAPAAELAVPAAGLSPDSALVVASRRHFDQALLDAAIGAGARLVPERVVDVRAGADGAEVRTRAGAHRGAWLIGADGANSLVRRRLVRPFTRPQLSIATGFFAHGVTSAEIAIACVSEPPGYIWSFPRPDHLAIGIGVQADSGAAAGGLRARVAAWLQRAGLAPGARLEPYAWPIPSLPAADLARERPAGPGWLLVGDAAGLVDPLTREGIYFALRSGEWAAAALAAGPAAAPARYRARLARELYPELRRAARAKAGFFGPGFTGLMVEALRRSAGIRAVMVDLIGGRQPYRGLRRRLLRTGELGLALRLLRLTIAEAGARRR
jgi:geranylgeranyl reductase family protein